MLLHVQHNSFSTPKESMQYFFAQANSSRLSIRSFCKIQFLCATSTTTRSSFCNTFIVRVHPCVTAKLPVLKPRFWNFMLIKNCARFLLLYCLLCWQSRQSSLQAPFFGRCYDPEPRCMEMWKCICELPFVLALLLQVMQHLSTLGILQVSPCNDMKAERMRLCSLESTEYHYDWTYVWPFSISR